MAASSSSALVQALSDVLPAGAVKAGELYRGIYGRDASYYDYRPQAVVLVSSVEEVQRLLAVARQWQVPVTFRAAGTSLCGQTLGTGIVADLRMAWKGVEVRDRDAAIWVEPGVTVAQVNQLLAPLGRKLGPDPESANAAMMGGVLANNSGGQQSGIEHDPYSTLQSLEFVLANGHRYDTADDNDRRRFTAEEQTITRGLAALRDHVRSNQVLVERIRRKYQIKNVMGYGLRSFLDADDPIDILARLLVGSEGTLAFIASATLATVTLHRNWAVGLLFFSDVTEAVAGARTLIDDGASTVELMDRACIGTWSGKPGAPAYLDDLPAEVTALLVEYRAATASELGKQLASAGGLIAGFGLVAGEFFTTDPLIRECWFGLRSAMYPLVAATRAPGTSVVIEDVAVPPDRLVDLILGLRELFAHYDTADTAFIFGHLAAGNVHFITLDDLRTGEGIKRFGLFIEDLTGLVLGLDGSLKAEHGTGRAMAPFLTREWGDEAVAVMREVKRLVDPGSLLNPGVLLSDDPQAHLVNIKRAPSVGDDTIDRCVECGFCEHVCPTRTFTLTPRQRVVGTRVALEFLEVGEARRANAVLDEFAFEGRDTCVADGLCGTVCPAEINVAYLTDHQRAETHGQAFEQLMDLAARRFALVEEVLRRGLSLGCAVDERLGPNAMSWATAAARRLVPDLPQWSRAITEAPPHAHRETANPQLVYFPSCVSRIMGSSAAGKDSLMATVLRVAERAGIGVRLPADVTGLCCGQIWEHKGFRTGQATMANRLVEALWRWSEGGRLPIMCDVTSCARTILVELEREQFGSRKRLLDDANQARYRQLRIMDLAEWLHDDVLGRLEIKRKKGSVLVHPTCACTQLGLGDKIAAVASACAEKVIVPSSLGCCGAGGDRGFLYPQLADAAMHDEADEIKRGSYDGAYSFAKTCEIVLADRTGRPYESLVYLVDEVTAPRGQIRLSI